MIGVVKKVWLLFKKLANIFMDLVSKIIKKEIPEKTRNNLFQFIKFGFVGVSNTLISIATYWLLISVKCNIYVANLAGFVLSVLNAFYWNNSYVFKKSKNAERNWLVALVKTFIAYGFTGLLLNSALLWLFSDKLGINEYISPVLNLFITIPVNFVMNKFWAFKEKRGNK